MEEDGFNPVSSGLWAWHASAAPSVPRHAFRVQLNWSSVPFYMMDCNGQSLDASLTLHHWFRRPVQCLLGLGANMLPMHHSAQSIFFAQSKDMHFGEMAPSNCPLVQFFHQSMSVFECFTCLEPVTHPGCPLSHIKGSWDQPKTFLIFQVKFRI